MLILWLDVSNSHIQEGNIVFPKTTNPQHMKDNFDIFDFELTEEDKAALDAMNTCDQHQDIWAYKRQQMY